MEPAPALTVPPPAAAPASDLNDRLAVSLVLIPVALVVIEAGGWPYVVAVAGILVIAAREYVRLFVHTHYRPATPVVVAGVGLLALSAHFLFLNPAHLLPAQVRAPSDLVRVHKHSTA